MARGWAGSNSFFDASAQWQKPAREPGRWPLVRKRHPLQLGFCFFLLLLPAFVHAQTDARALVQEVQTASYPELKDARIEVKTFRGESDYFQSRFSFGRFLTGRRMRYVVYVNPAIYDKNCPAAARRAIVAHELAHILYYRQRNRLQLLGLARLAGANFTAKFERGADLEALARGYGEGLKQYRVWLYQNIPPRKLAAKRRDYFSPEEIDALLSALQTRPALLDYWRKHPPRKLAEIRKS